MELEVQICFDGSPEVEPPIDPGNSRAYLKRKLAGPIITTVKPLINEGAFMLLLETCVYWRPAFIDFTIIL